MLTISLKKKHTSYPEYQDSGVEWLGKIPEGWHIEKLKYLSPQRYKKTMKISNDVKYIGLENIESGSGKVINIHENQEVESIVNVFEKGDVLFGKLRPYLAKVTAAPFSGVCTGELLVLMVQKDRIKPLFLFYRLLSRDFIKLVDDSTYGAKMPRAGWEFIGNVYIQYPAIEAQQKIAAYLDEKTALIEKIIEKKKRLIKLLQEKREAIINKAVTKGLDDSVEFVASRVEWLGKIPKSWSLRKLKFIARIFNGATPKSDVVDYWEGEINWVTPDDLSNINSKELNNTRRTITSEGYRSCGTNLITKDNLILSTRAPIGLLAINKTDVCTNQGCKGIVFGKNFNVEYYYYLFLAISNELNNMGSGTTFKELSHQKLSDFVVSVPEEKIQQKIAAYLDEKTALIDSAIQRIQRSIEFLQEFKASLISHIVTGKIMI